MRITTRTLSYTTADGLTLQSYLCLPEEAPNELSGVLVAPEWWGLSDHAKHAAERLAEAEEKAKDEVARLRLRHETRQLTVPEAMGERFQFIGFEREVEFEHAFLAGDLSWRL